MRERSLLWSGFLEIEEKSILSPVHAVNCTPYLGESKYQISNLPFSQLISNFQTFTLSHFHYHTFTTRPCLGNPNSNSAILTTRERIRIKLSFFENTCIYNVRRQIWFEKLFSVHYVGNMTMPGYNIDCRHISHQKHIIFTKPIFLGIGLCVQFDLGRVCEHDRTLYLHCEGSRVSRDQVCWSWQCCWWWWRWQLRNINGVHRTTVRLVKWPCQIVKFSHFHVSYGIAWYCMIKYDIHGPELHW